MPPTTWASHYDDQAKAIIFYLQHFQKSQTQIRPIKIKLHSQYYIHAIYLMPSGNALIVLVAKFSQKVKFENEVILEAFIQ
jgi:hypothetical protein